MIRDRFLLALLLIPLLAGCNTQAKWTYPIHSDALYHTAKPEGRLVIGVLPFEEDRPVENRAATIFLYLIPLMPYGWATYERPEAAKSFNTIAEYDFDMDEDLGKAATRSLKSSGLFRRVYFTLGGETKEADYLFRGTARRTLYEGKIFSYGLSAVGPLLWYIGLPVGTSENAIEFDFDLIDPDQNVVWSYTAKGDHTITQGLYYNTGSDVLHFATLMETAMNDALRDLESKLRPDGRLPVAAAK